MKLRMCVKSRRAASSKGVARRVTAAANRAAEEGGGEQSNAMACLVAPVCDARLGTCLRQ